MSHLPPVVQKAGEHIQDIIREGEKRVDRLLADVEKSEKVQSKGLSSQNADEIAEAIAKYLDALKLRVYEKLQCVKSLNEEPKASLKWREVRGGEEKLESKELGENVLEQKQTLPETKGREITSQIEGEKPPQVEFIETKEPAGGEQTSKEEFKEEYKPFKGEFKEKIEEHPSSKEALKTNMYEYKQHKFTEPREELKQERDKCEPLEECRQEKPSECKQLQAQNYELNPNVEEFHPKGDIYKPIAEQDKQLKKKEEPKSMESKLVEKYKSQDIKPEEIAATEPSLKSTEELSDIYKSPFEPRLYTKEKATVKEPFYEIPPPILHKDDEQIKKQQEQFASQVLSPELQPRESKGYAKLQEPKQEYGVYASRNLEDIETSKYHEDKSVLEKTSELASSAAEKTGEVAANVYDKAGDVAEGLSEYVEQLKNEVTYKWEDIKDTLKPQHHRDIQDELIGHAEREEKFQEEIRDVGCDF